MPHTFIIIFPSFFFVPLIILNNLSLFADSFLMIKSTVLYSIFSSVIISFNFRISVVLSCGLFFIKLGFFRYKFPDFTVCVILHLLELFKDDYFEKFSENLKISIWVWLLELY